MNEVKPPERPYRFQTCLVCTRCEEARAYARDSGGGVCPRCGDELVRATVRLEVERTERRLLGLIPWFPTERILATTYKIAGEERMSNGTVWCHLEVPIENPRPYLDYYGF